MTIIFALAALMVLLGSQFYGHYVAQAFDEASFKKEPDDKLKKRLTPLQYKVTQHEGTERPFNNEYWDNKKPGIYVDIVSGEPLFAIDHFKEGMLIA